MIPASSSCPGPRPSGSHSKVAVAGAARPRASAPAKEVSRRMPSLTRALAAVFCSALSLLAACSAAQEARGVELRMVTDSVGLEAISTDLGYEVVLSSASVAVDDLQFTIAGEVHASQWRRVLAAVIPSAHAHPGHFQGGEITGELPGHFML